MAARRERRGVGRALLVWDFGILGCGCAAGDVVGERLCEREKEKGDMVLWFLQEDKTRLRSMARNWLLL